MLALSFTSKINAKNIYLPVPKVEGLGAVYELLDSIENTQAQYEYILYCHIDSCRNRTSYVLDAKDSTIYLFIGDGNIIAKRKSNLSAIFRFRDKYKTGAILQEDKLQFIPPLFYALETELIIYKNHRKCHFYFEYGKNISTYAPQRKRQPYRYKWLQLIRNKIKNDYH